MSRVDFWKRTLGPLGFHHQPITVQISTRVPVLSVVAIHNRCKVAGRRGRLNKFADLSFVAGIIGYRDSPAAVGISHKRPPQFREKR